MLDLTWAVHTKANHRRSKGTFGENKMATKKESEGVHVLPKFPEVFYVVTMSLYVLAMTFFSILSSEAWWKIMHPEQKS